MLNNRNIPGRNNIFRIAKVLRGLKEIPKEKIKLGTYRTGIERLIKETTKSDLRNNDQNSWKKVTHRDKEATPKNKQ